MGRMNRIVFGLVVLATTSVGMKMSVDWTMPVANNPDDKIDGCQCYDFRTCDAIQGSYVKDRECEVKARITMEYPLSEVIISTAGVAVPANIEAIDSMYRHTAEIQGIRAVHRIIPGCEEPYWGTIGMYYSKPELASLGQRDHLDWSNAGTVGTVVHRISSSNTSRIIQGYSSEATIADHDFYGFSLSASTDISCALEIESFSVTYLIRYRMGDYKADRGTYDVSYPCGAECTRFMGLKECVAAVHETANKKDVTCDINHVHLHRANTTTPDKGEKMTATIDDSGMCLGGDKPEPFDALDVMLIGPAKPLKKEAVNKAFDYAYENNIRDCGTTYLLDAAKGEKKGHKVIRWGKEYLRIVPDDTKLFKKGFQVEFTSENCKFKPVAWVKHQRQTISKNKPLDP